MAALTTATPRRTRIWGYSVNANFPVANAVTVYQGSWCMIPGIQSFTSTRGYARPYTTAQGGLWIGMAIGSPFDLSVTNTIVGDTSASVVPEVSVEAAPFVFERATVTGVSAQGDVRQSVYASNDNDLTLTRVSAEHREVGMVLYWYSSTTADVLFFGLLNGLASNVAV